MAPALPVFRAGMMMQGYLPTRDQMLAVRQSAIDLIEIFDRYRLNSGQHLYPKDVAIRFAVRSIFKLERALNPDRLPWDDPRRKTPETLAWPFPVAEGLAWLRELLDDTVSREVLESMAVAESFESWIAGRPFFPTSITVFGQALESFESAVESLGAVDGSTISYPEFSHSSDRAPSWSGTGEKLRSEGEAVGKSQDFDTGDVTKDCPVVLFGPLVPAWVCNRRAEPFTEKQFPVVKALVEAYPMGLSAAKLKCKCGLGDARGIITRLKQQKETWARVIKAGGGKGYRLAWPADHLEPRRTHAGPAPTPTESAPTLIRPTLDPRLTPVRPTLDPHLCN